MIICRSMLLPQLGQRHAFLLQRRRELLLVLELVLLADVGDDLRELLVGEREAQLLAALQQQHLVDRVDEDLRRHLGERLLQLVVVLRVARVRLPCSSGADGRDLPLLELGLGEDLAVHLHEHLLDDLGGRHGTD